MKAFIKYLLSLNFLAFAVIILTSCSKDEMGQGFNTYASVIDVANDGSTSFIESNLKSAFVETTGLTADELGLILKMKDEEKLARDVYAVLYEKWGSTVFSRITNAENNHLYAIIRLLQYYGEADTLVSEAGIFANADVQALYNTLITKGSVSVEEAYKTGALIEEMDIKDLSVSIASTSNENITMVFENLERGSRNHLRAFNNQLTALGVVYTPLYITQDEYTQIVTSATEKGKQYRMQGKRNGQGNGDCNGSGQQKRKGKN